MTAEELKAWAQNLPDTATVEAMSVSDDGKGTVTWNELKLGEIRAVIGSQAPFRDHPVGIDTIRPHTVRHTVRRPGRPRVTDPIARARKRQRRAAA